MGLVNIDTEKLAKTFVEEAAKVLPGILEAALGSAVKGLGEEARATLQDTLGEIESVTITINRKQVEQAPKPQS